MNGLIYDDLYVKSHFSKTYKEISDKVDTNNVIFLKMVESKLNEFSL